MKLKKYNNFINESANYSTIKNHMLKMFQDECEKNPNFDDDALLAERTADDLDIDMEEYEDLLFDTAMEVVSGNF